MMADGLLPRWKRTGQPVLHTPCWINRSSLHTGQLGNSVLCSDTQVNVGLNKAPASTASARACLLVRLLCFKVAASATYTQAYPSSRD